MKVGIIVYSKTGNTLSVAKLIKDRLIQDNNTVNIEVIEISGNPEKDMNNFKLEYSPLVSGYDFLIFGAPVNAFSLCQVMIRYLKEINTLENKQIACFVTQQLPYPWMGGNHAISQMKKICDEKQGNIKTIGIINWSSKKKEQLIDELITNIVKSLNK